MRISDWSSDVCSSDLVRYSRCRAAARPAPGDAAVRGAGSRQRGSRAMTAGAQTLADSFPDEGNPPPPVPLWLMALFTFSGTLAMQELKRDVKGKSVSVRLSRGGRRISKKKNTT